MLIGIIFYDKETAISKHLDMPEDTSFVLLLTTGRDLEEKTHINYLNEEGVRIGEDLINNKSNDEALSYNPNTGSYELFTLDKIYAYNDKEDQINDEMLTTYAFASDNGNDLVYKTGYLDKIQKSYKVISHGYAYAESQLGTFDLLTVYDDESIQNIRITDNTTVVSDQENATLYALESLSHGMINYEKITFTETDDSYQKTEGQFSLADFAKDAQVHIANFTIGEAILHENKLYLILNCPRGEKEYDVRLAEFAMDHASNRFTYVDQYPIEVPDNGAIEIAVKMHIKQNLMKIYSPASPLAIYTFNLEDKSMSQSPFPERKREAFEIAYQVKIIDDQAYALDFDIDNNIYRIYKISDDDAFTLLVENEIPKPKRFSYWWRTDFQVIT